MLADHRLTLRKPLAKVGVEIHATLVLDEVIALEAPAPKVLGVYRDRASSFLLEVLQSVFARGRARTPDVACRETDVKNSGFGFTFLITHGIETQAKL